MYIHCVSWSRNDFSEKDEGHKHETLHLCGCFSSWERLFPLEAFGSYSSMQSPHQQESVQLCLLIRRKPSPGCFKWVSIHYHCMNIIVGCFLFESDGTLFGKWWLCLASYVANHWNRKLQRVACCNARRRKAHESTLFVFEASEPDPEFVVIPELMLMMLLLLMMMMMINFTGSLYIWVEITTFACIYRFSIKPIHWNVLVAWILGDACSKVFDEAWISKYIKLPWGSFLVRYLTFRPWELLKVKASPWHPLGWVRMSHHNKAINSRHVVISRQRGLKNLGNTCYVAWPMAQWGCRLRRPDGPTIVSWVPRRSSSWVPLVFACFASWMCCMEEKMEKGTQPNSQFPTLLGEQRHPMHACCDRIQRVFANRTQPRATNCCWFTDRIPPSCSTLQFHFFT